jgi:hypothetical protein
VGGPATLRLELLERAEGLELLVATDADPSGWPPAGLASTVGWQILAALADEARAEPAEGRPAVRLAKRRVAAGTR